MTLLLWSIFLTCIPKIYGVYGVRKMWRVLQRKGINIRREHTGRLMRSAYLSGKGKGGSTNHSAQAQRARILAQTWNIVNVGFLALIGCGWRRLPTCAPGKALCTPRS